MHGSSGLHILKHNSIMTLFQLIIIVTGFVFLLFAVDLYQRQKFNFLHFLVFFGGTAVVVVFALTPSVLDSFGSFFGIARGADLVVYISIVALAYFYFELLHTQTKQSAQITKLVSRLAWQSVKKTSIIPKRINDWKKKYWFLIRSYNESSMIEEVIEEIIHAWYTTIIVCDDWSSDLTWNIINTIQKNHNSIHLILLTHPINRWPGAANKTLFEYVSMYQNVYFDDIERWVTYDADGQMSIEDMVTFQKYADNEKYDIIIWSRFVEWWKTINMPLTRRIILRWWRIVTYVFNGSWLRDVTTWYRMYHRSVLPKITITSDWFSYQHQIIDALRDHSLNFIEIPVTIKYTEYSLHKGQSSGSALKILKELLYRTFFYK